MFSLFFLRVLCGLHSEHQYKQHDRGKAERYEDAALGTVDTGGFSGGLHEAVHGRYGCGDLVRPVA